MQCLWGSKVAKVRSEYPFADGCKRIAASLFLEFLERNDALLRDSNGRMSIPL